MQIWNCRYVVVVDDDDDDDGGDGDEDDDDDGYDDDDDHDDHDDDEDDDDDEEEEDEDEDEDEDDDNDKNSVCWRPLLERDSLHVLSRTKKNEKYFQVNGEWRWLYDWLMDVDGFCFNALKTCESVGIIIPSGVESWK